MKATPKSITVFDGDNNNVTVPCKKCGENIVPVGCFYDEGERYDALVELLLSSIFPLLYKLNENILSLFRCKQSEVIYDIYLSHKRITPGSLSQSMLSIIDTLKYIPADVFDLLINIECEREIDGSIRKWGKQVHVAYGCEKWYNDQTDEEYLVWLVYIGPEQTNLETPFGLKQVETIVDDITSDMFAYFIAAYGSEALELRNEDEPLSHGKAIVKLSLKLDRMLQFLKENRYYNMLVQQSEFQKVLLPFEKPADKLISLLYHVYNTQSKPGLDFFASFMKKVQAYPPVCTFTEFIGRLSKMSNVSLQATYQGLFEGLKIQPGWGEKTAALFAKAIYTIHNSESTKHLRFWSDAPLPVHADNIYLPVDAVIRKIFEKMSDGGYNDFSRINQLLQGRYTIEEMETWDDLWFWGFITQKSNSRGEREDGFVFNNAKYWSLMALPKDNDHINAVRLLANEFISIIYGRNE